MPTLKDLLKAKGYTDADLENMSTLLNDQRFSSVIDDVDRSAREARDAEWEATKTSQWQPIIAKAEQEAIQARMEAANAREQLKIAKDYGYLNDDEAKARLEAQEREQQQRQQQQQQNRGGFNPDDPTFQKVIASYSRQEGDAIALHHFLGEEYRSLMGDSVNSYENAQGLRGLPALRAEAMAANQRLDAYMENKFNWNGKRAEMRAKRQAEHDAAISKQAVEKYIMDHPQLHTQPMLQGPKLSNSPFIPNRGDSAKQPWDGQTAGVEADMQQRRSARIQRAAEAELKKNISVQ